MKITLSPQRRDDLVTYERSNDSLMVNGELFDFSLVEEGDVLPRNAIQSEFFAGDVARVSGKLELTLILPNPANYSPLQAFPAPIIVTKNGLVELPKPLADTTKESVDEQY